MQDFTEYQLGETDVLVPLEDREQHLLATQHMLQQCHRTVHIISRDLDPAIYAQPEFCDALTRIVLDNRRIQVRILVHEVQAIARGGHRLLEVANKLTGFIEMRKPGPDHKDYNGAMFVGDAIGFITRRTADRYLGKMNFNDQRESNLLINEFDEIWEKSIVDANLRKFVM